MSHPPRIPRTSYGASHPPYNPRDPDQGELHTRLILMDFYSDAGSNCLGQALAPVEMRKAGLEQKLRDLGYVTINVCAIDEMRFRGGDINLARGVRNEVSCYGAICEAEDAVKRLEFKDTKIFLGGDCSILPGILSGMNKIPAIRDKIRDEAYRIGVVYFSGDNNLKLPPQPGEPIDDLSGILDLMNLSTLTQREGCLELASTFNTHHEESHIFDENIILFGTTDPPDEEQEAYIDEKISRHVSRTRLLQDPSAVKKIAQDELNELSDEYHLIVVHFNVDVIDSETFPLANYPIPGGLPLAVAMEALGVFLTSEQLGAVFITGINPLNDPDGSMVRDLVDGFVGAMRVRLRSITDGRMG